MRCWPVDQICKKSSHCWSCKTRPAIWRYDALIIHGINVQGLCVNVDFVAKLTDTCCPCPQLSIVADTSNDDLWTIRSCHSLWQKIIERSASAKIASRDNNHDSILGADLEKAVEHGFEGS